ncbi:hydroxyacylglutathione hydrolase [Kiloniella laminariae]|uniref:Hydroxyacylglutathione hydrolase n=1 Tax=Kiloniella laminariae TaxID=454162 RepID=A0ABT4LKL2_9PROT|nr:hydroxyacylglutathione hydrolase [Kiloniella laminariae]MCZ4281630.1 hydroxyacylglutathione hydrolase [Kiloniella laminariae]
MPLEVRQIPILSDNYCYLLRDPVSGAVAVIDPGEAQPVMQQAGSCGWKITHILLTHHHHDHIGGIAEIKAATGATVIGPAKEQQKISLLEQTLDGGQQLLFGSETAEIFSVPGHTLGHIAFWFRNSALLFSGDSLFALGCGRLFEGTGEMMWQSLKQYLSLPPETLVYCAHEYTLSNARFALNVDPDNSDLIQRVEEIERLRQHSQPTVPSRLGDEFATNPFLRPGDPKIRKRLAMSQASDEEVFTELRHRKDNF